MDFAGAGTVLLLALMVATMPGARAQWLAGEGARFLYAGAGTGSSPGPAGATQGTSVAASASASAHATASASSSGTGTCSAQSSAQAEAQAGGDVVRKSTQKRVEQKGSGCSASAQSSAEVSVGPSAGAPQR